MKNLSLFFAVAIAGLFYSSEANAQATVTYGPELGFTASGLYDKSNEDIYAGLHVHGGVTAHVQVGGFFAIRPSLLFQTGKFENPDYGDVSTKLTRIYVPVPLLFSKNFENDNKLYFGAGPYIKYAIAGKSNNNIDYDMHKIKFGNSTTDEMKRPDVGLHFRGGFDFSRGTSLGLFLNWGLNNIDPRGTDYKLKSIDAIGFSFAWMFGGNNAD